MVDRSTTESSLEQMVLALLDSQVVGEEQVDAQVRTFAASFFPGLDDATLTAISSRLLERLSIQLELGVAVTDDDFVSWLPERKGSIDWKRWGAYRKLLLQQGRALKVIDKLGESTDEILDLAGNPQEPGDWQRRGLVIGEVQSGKTSTYIGFINKAADAGYRLFILIGGHTESLRRQTQTRVDEGFVGRDSAYMSKELRHLVDQKLVGVGSIDPRIRAYGFTTVTSDFSIRSAQSFNFEVSEDMSEPVVLVVKKNTRILNNLRDWLRDQAPSGGHTMPLLLLDDEADYASINTREEDDPTAVNGAIRDLLELSHRSSYVGFTATPFANVLIDDTNEQDLFPRNFIYTLESPSNYMGADAIFGEAADDVLLPLDDAEEVFPLQHKSTLIVDVLPDTLVDAIAAFIVANAIRDIRGDVNEPRSMLINVSRFNNPQSQVHELVEEQLAAFRNAIEFDTRDGSSELLNRLRQIFEREYSTRAASWAEIELALRGAVESMEAVLVNSRSNSADTYTKLAAAGRTRIIATGGAVLSRGVTLNGLMTSYFYQRSRAADTLMQMGRWFGYRDGYRDLTRIWMDDEVASWYGFVAESGRELREDLREMNRLLLTPKDFGLKVRKHPEALLVTAANKSKAAQLVQRTISLRDKTLESAKLLADPTQLNSNVRAAKKLIREALEEGQVEASGKHVIVRQVSKALIADFLNEFGSAVSDPFFVGPLAGPGESAMASYVRSEIDRDMQFWDVLVIGGSKALESLGDYSVARVQRALKLRDGHLLVSGDRRRVAGPTDLAPLVRPHDIQTLKENKQTDYRLTERDFRSLLKSPAVVLYFLDTDEFRHANDEADVPEVIVGVKIAFPADPLGMEHEVQSNSGIKYLINSVLQRDWLPDLFLDLDDSDRDNLDD